MKPLTKDAQQVSTYVNFTCLVLVLGALLAIKIYIHFSADYSARWLVIEYLPFFLITVTVWFIACLVSTVSWVKKGNSKMPLIARVATLSLPIVVMIVSIT